MTKSHIKPVIFAHRGASGYEYENSETAFKKGIQLGADGLETDCWLLKDKKTIIIHHDRILYLKENHQKYSLLKMSLNEIKALALPNGDKILTLREFFDKFSHAKTINNEMVKFSIDLQDLKVGDLIIRLLKEYDLFHRVYLCSDSLISLKRTRKESREVMLVASNMQDLISTESLESDGKIGRIKVNVFNIRARDFNPRYQTVLEKYGLKMFIWNLQTPDQIKKFIKISTDAFFTDFPDIAVKLRAQLNHKQI